MKHLNHPFWNSKRLQNRLNRYREIVTHTWHKLNTFMRYAADRKEMMTSFPVAVQRLSIVPIQCTDIAEHTDSKLKMCVRCPLRARAFIKRSGVSPIATTSVGCRRSSVTKWAGRMTQKWFDLESPNFMRTFTPTVPTGSTDVTSLDRQLLQKNEIAVCTALVEFIENCLTHNRQNSQSYGRWPASPADRIWRQQLIPIDGYMQLNTACKCVMRRVE